MEVLIGTENSDKHVDTKLIIMCGNDRLVIHVYNGTQNLMVQGKNYQKFAIDILKPFFIQKIEVAKEKITKINDEVKQTLGTKKSLKCQSGKPFKCPQCEQKTLTKGELKMHMKTCHTKPGISPLKSRKIMKFFNEDSALATNDHLELQYIGAEDMTVDNQELNSHYVPEVEDLVSCKFCEYDTSDQQDLKNHESAIHGQDVRPDGTEEVIKSISSSQENMVANEADTCTICGDCGKGFDSVEECHIHMTNHVATIRIKCDQCQFVSKSAEESQDHMKSYHEHVHKITECNNDLPSRSDLLEHVKLKHEMKSKHICTSCEHLSDTEDGLKTHYQLVHKEIQVDVERASLNQTLIPIKCDHCDQDFKYNIQLNKHIQKQHRTEEEDWKFQCNFCTFRTQHIFYMYEHKFEKHPDTPSKFIPNKITAKDRALNLIAEQSIEMYDELKRLKTFIKESFENISNVIKNNSMDIEQIIDNKIDARKLDVEENRKAEAISIPLVPQPSRSAPSSLTPAPSPPGTRSKSVNKKKKTAYQRKPKILYLGDSIAHSADIAKIERETNTRIKTETAYSSIHDGRSRWPNKNFNDLTPAVLGNVYEGDEFTHLILSAPTVDISNIDATKVTSEDNIEVYKQKIAISCENMLTTANQALLTQPQLQSVVIMEHLPRFDLAIYDPTGLKAKLAKFANSTLAQ